MRIRTVLRLAVVASLLGWGSMGCGAKDGVEPPAPRADGEPLSLFLEGRSEGWLVRVNDRVQVAIFEVLPTVGAGMIYPSGPKGKWLDAGDHAVLTRGGVIRRHRAAYLERASGPLGGPPMAAVMQGTRRMLVGVACTCELRLEELGTPGGPREILGPFAGLNAEEALPKIVQSVLPRGSDLEGAEWVVARF